MEHVRIQIHGIVQGVGFRPFIHRLVGEFGLNGTVKNTSSGVELELEGARETLEAFLRALPGGVTDVVLILAIEAFVAVFGFPVEQLHTMSAVVMTVVGLRVLYQSAQPFSDPRHWGLILAMALGETVAFTFLGPLFSFTAPTVETGLVLAVLAVVAFQVMRPALQFFEAAETGCRKLRDLWREKRHGPFKTQEKKR